MNYSRYRSVLSLRKGQNHSAGRNSSGKITVRHRGGGHKQSFRSINWTRTEKKALVVGFEYDPLRNAPLAKLYHESSAAVLDSEQSSKSINNLSQPIYSYILAPSGVKLFQELYTYAKPNQISAVKKTSSTHTTSVEGAKLLQPGDKAPISFFEPGDFIHAVESFPGQGAVFGRSAGSFCQFRSVVSRGGQLSQDNVSQSYAKVRLPSGSQRLISLSAQATFGVVASKISHHSSLRKAGRARWLGRRPSVRGVARNPVDHPHGGGQGKTSGGRPSVTFKSWPTKGRPTRNPKRRNPFILTPRES